MRAVLAVLAMIWALAFGAAAQDLSALARLDAGKSRVSGGNGGLAVELAISQPVPWRVRMLDGPPRLVLDVREVDWAGADRLAAQIEEMELGSPARDRAERDLISRSVMVEIDPEGRIVLPPKVREKMGFLGDDLTGGGEAAFAGFTNRFKLYRREVYEAELADEDDDDGVDPLALVGRASRGG